jgi:hypothetical protein
MLVEGREVLFDVGVILTTGIKFGTKVIYEEEAH